LVVLKGAYPGVAKRHPTGRAAADDPTQKGSSVSVHRDLGLTGALFAGMRAVLDGLFTTVLVLYFLLVSGDIFLRRIVEILPKFSDKRQAVDISQQIQQDVSAYLVTITAMNATVGIATAAAMYFCGLVARWYAMPTVASVTKSATRSSLFFAICFSRAKTIFVAAAEVASAI
jgi:hypothetical protein